jgi:hypothetical protein
VGLDLGGYEKTAGPSTAPLAIKLREASLRMTILSYREASLGMAILIARDDIFVLMHFFE